MQTVDSATGKVLATLNADAVAALMVPFGAAPGPTLGPGSAGLSSYPAYGADVVSVARGVVVGTKDGIADNVPVGSLPPFSLETVGGNYVSRRNPPSVSASTGFTPGTASLNHQHPRPSTSSSAQMSLASRAWLAAFHASTKPRL